MSRNKETPQEMLLKYDGSVPRYTSYPPANFFTRDPADVDYEGMLLSSNQTGPRNMSLYFHIPFCPGRCLFCGCHTEIGRPGALIKDYLETIHEEFHLLLPYLDRSRPVTQIHFGGGTPNSVPPFLLEKLLRTIASELEISPTAEIAMECDPSLILLPKLEEYRRMGFNRLSFGIQDVNLRVLQSVKREPSRMPEKELVQACHALGFKGVNLDLIYGLPFQTPESFKETLNTIIEANPDRISLFPYAHVPWVKDHQAALQAFPMPDATTRLQIAMESRETLLRAGYVAIGMDHFARPDDDLAIAQREGTLHRNFQGYCPSFKTGQVYAMGASGISQLHQGYFQNEKDLSTYRTQVKAGRLPIRTAYRMTPRDLVVREIINALLCQGQVDLNQALSDPELDAEWKTSLAMNGLEKLASFIEDGLVLEDNGVITIPPEGILLSRMIAAAFDPNLKQETLQPLYSKAL